MNDVVDSGGAADITANAERVRWRIRAAGGDPGQIAIIAVTKAFPGVVARAALEAGLNQLGESYAQELLDKARDLVRTPLQREPKWHFIGRLQSNKVRDLAPLVALWHTVDRASLAAPIARHAPGAEVLIQVNATAEAQKGGCAPEDVAELVVACQSLDLVVRGLMTVGVFGDPERTRSGFRACRGLADRLGLPDCSMGMSGDLEIAVEEGSTMVRIGRDLFGARP